MEATREAPKWSDDAAALVLQFVNTRADGAGRVEVFDTASGFADWAIEQGLLAATIVVTDSDAVAARELRDALVTMLLTHAGDSDIGDALVAEAERYLLQAGVRYPLATVVTAKTAQLLAGSSGVPGALSAVLAAVTETAQRGDWMRIKACCNPPCHFGFIDRTRNRTARYCSPGCGSQVSMRALRQRRKQAGS
ncbi:CGNR zinc finger domain-containing protein [Nocardia lijiangensis]|uniref:CGNR zinc finger domain-containing protein n=1 Tax=Nocardia lijiangensis TaxID=299618 RepID=UPI000A65B0F0|nr:CGNR zinc finger domain-containing protein [Nocardia lijiangensis]